MKTEIWLIHSPTKPTRRRLSFKNDITTFERGLGWVAQKVSGDMMELPVVEAGFFSRDAMKSHSDGHAAHQEQEPAGVVCIDISSDNIMYGTHSLGQKPDQKTLMMFKDLEGGTKIYSTTQKRKEPEQEPMTDKWRKLALQFDAHRMMALSHLRAMLQDSEKHADVVREFLEAAPPQPEPMTDEMVTAAARLLNERQADACGVDRDDQWAIYSDDFKADARAMLKAAHGIKVDA